MDQADLVFNIVCDVVAPSSIYTKNEVAMIMLVNKCSVGSKLLHNSSIVHKAKYLLQLLRKNTKSLVLCKEKKDTEKTKRMEKVQKKILDSVFADSLLLDFFTMGLISEYKEQMYKNKTDYYFTYEDRITMYEYELIIDKYFGGEQKVFEHIHDPNNPIFHDTNKYNYTFYYYHEIYKGCSVLNDEQFEDFQDYD